MFPFFKLLVSAFFPLFILLVIYRILSTRLSCASQSHRNPPPSPWKLPIIGNFHQLVLSNHRTLVKLAEKHGSLMLLHLGSHAPVLIASSVDAAREILKTHELMFLNRPETSNISKITYNFKDIVFCPYGEYSRYVKNFSVNHLLSHKRVSSFQRVREEEVTLMMEMIGESCGSRVNFSELISSHTNNIFCMIALGRKFEWKKVKDLIEQSIVLAGLFKFGDYIPLLSWVDKLRGLDGRLNLLMKQFDEFLEGLIEEHLHKKRIESPKLFIDLLLQENKNEDEDDPRNRYFQRDNIKSLLLEMFVGGTNQPFTTLEWTLSELIRNPRTMKKLQQEVKEIAQGKPRVSEDDLGKLPYLKAVFKESLRLHPVTPLIPRQLTQDVKIMGYDIEAKTKVFINIWAIGRDSTIWDQPEEFRPERFLNSRINYKGSFFEFIPFGTGKRGCPAIQYSEAINELTLANLVYRFDLELPKGERVEDLDMSEGSGALIHRKNNLVLVATPASK